MASSRSRKASSIRSFSATGREARSRRRARLLSRIFCRSSLMEYRSRTVVQTGPTRQGDRAGQGRLCSKRIRQQGLDSIPIIPFLRILRLVEAILCFCTPFLPFPFQMAKFIQILTRQPKTIRRRFAMARQENQQHVANRCRCVASRKAQRNPCKIGLVAVLPIFQTCISILPFFAADLSFDGGQRLKSSWNPH